MHDNCQLEITSWGKPLVSKLEGIIIINAPIFPKFPEFRSYDACDFLGHNTSFSSSEQDSLCSSLRKIWETRVNYS